METLLNLIWLVISVAGIWIWLRWWSPRHVGNEARLKQGWMALIVLIFLLFPVISMTDDLHPGPAYMEDSSASKRRAPALRQAAAHRIHSHTQSAAVATLPRNPDFALALLDSVKLAVERSFASSASRLTASDRSPPAIPS
jgi:hypothetical protein